MRLDLLVASRFAIHTTGRWCEKGGRASGYKRAVLVRAHWPLAGHQQGCDGRRSVAACSKTSTSTCNPANSAKSAPTRPPSPRLRKGAPAAGTTPPTPPPPCRWVEVTSPCPPAPRHRGGRAPGTQIGPGAAPEPPKTPLGLLGLVVVAGGSRSGRYWAPCPSDTRVRAAWPAAVNR